MKILLTGATGFLGAHTAAKLLDHHHDVYLLGRNFDRDATRMQILMRRGAKPLQVDLRDRGAVLDACRGM